MFVCEGNDLGHKKSWVGHSNCEVVDAGVCSCVRGYFEGFRFQQGGNCAGNLMVDVRSYLYVVKDSKKNGVQKKLEGRSWLRYGLTD